MLSPTSKRVPVNPIDMPHKHTLCGLCIGGEALGFATHVPTQPKWMCVRPTSSLAPCTVRGNERACFALHTPNNITQSSLDSINCQHHHTLKGIQLDGLPLPVAHSTPLQVVQPVPDVLLLFEVRQLLYGFVQ